MDLILFILFTFGIVMLDLIKFGTMKGNARLVHRLLKQELIEHLQKFPTSPFLFIGSGLSRRYMGLEDWEGLLRKFSALTDRPYDYYRSTAGGDLPRVATVIAERLHDTWWTEVKFAESRKKYSDVAMNLDSALKIEISKYMQSMTKNITSDKDLLVEIELLRNAVVDGVITTNWDQFIEKILPDFRVYIGQEELLFATRQAIGEIYKVHGCSSKPDSLVLTSNDYALFEERNPYLASKLLTTFVEHPIVFLGYSMTDKNIESILRSIAACLTTDNIDQLRDRLIFVRWRPDEPNYNFQRSSIVTEGFSIPVVSIEAPSFIPVFEALASLRQKFPAPLLRKLKDHVYQLVRTNDPNGNLYVQDLEDEDNSSNIDVVFGVGAISQLGYRTLDRDQLLRDVLFGNGRFHAKSVVDHVLPEKLKKSKIVPIFKYLSEAGLIDSEGNVNEYDIPPRVKAAAKLGPKHTLPSRSSVDQLRKDVECNNPTFYELIDEYKRNDALYRIPLLEPDQIPLTALHDYLKDNEGLLDEGPLAEQVQYRKNICLYDYLRYFPRCSGSES